jgi:proline-specific peptidase
MFMHPLFVTVLLTAALSFTFAPLAYADDLFNAIPEPTQELMVPVEGGKVYVRINGELSSKTLPAVFIHGGPGGRHNFFSRLIGLADERAIILYDQLDSGKSEQPNDPNNWRVERFVQELEAIRIKLDIEQWHIVGHSWGAAIALEYSVRYPERVGSTVFGGTFISTSHWVKDANLLIGRASKLVQETLFSCESKTPPSKEECQEAFRNLYSKYYTPVPVGKEIVDYDVKTGGTKFNSKIYNAMWGPSEFSSSGSLLTYDGIGHLAKLDGKRTMFIVGQYDSARVDTVQDYVTMTPGAELSIIPGGSHGYIKDRPMETEAILRGWFRRNKRED